MYGCMSTLTVHNLRTFSPSRFETTAYLWHLWFICAVYKFTYLPTYNVFCTGTERCCRVRFTNYFTKVNQITIFCDISISVRKFFSFLFYLSLFFAMIQFLGMQQDKQAIFIVLTDSVFLVSVIISVCPSVCLLHVGIVSKGLNTSLNYFTAW